MKSKGSVIRAATKLDLPQSTVGLALGKLRGHYNDQLSAIRHGDGADARAGKSSGCAPCDRNAAAGACGPADVRPDRRETGGVQICISDINEIVLLPRLLNHLGEVGPGIRLDISWISRDSPAALADGTVNVAVKFVPHLAAGFYRQVLFDQRFVCLLCHRHPRVDAALSVEQLGEEGPMRVRTSGTRPFDRRQAVGNRRYPAQGPAERTQLPWRGAYLAQTELLAIDPLRYARALEATAAVRHLPVQVDLPSRWIKQHWHERVHANVSIHWMRQAMAALFSGTAKGPIARHAWRSTRLSRQSGNGARAPPVRGHPGRRTFHAHRDTLSSSLLRNASSSRHNCIAAWLTWTIIPGYRR